MRSDEEILAELKKAAADLFVMSESDYPFDLVRWDGPAEVAPEFLRAVTGEPTDAAIEEREFDTFMGRYPILAQVLKTNLADLKIYRVGRINMPVYVVGRSPNGNWLGVSTRVVET